MRRRESIDRSVCDCRSGAPTKRGNFVSGFWANLTVTPLNGALASRSRVIASETQAAAPSTATLTYAWLRVARRQFMATNTNVSTNRYHDAIEVGLCI